MSKLNEVSTTQNISNVVRKENEEENLPRNSSGVSEKNEKKASPVADGKNDVLRFTMLFNKVSSDLDVKKGCRKSEEDVGGHRRGVKGTMFFNKEVKVSPAEPSKPPDLKDTENSNSTPSPSTKPSHPKSRPFSFKTPVPEFGLPQISVPEMMFTSSLTFSALNVIPPRTDMRIADTEGFKRLLNKRSSKLNDGSFVQLHVAPEKRTALRTHNSLTALNKNSKLGSKSALKSKIPSLTAIETTAVVQKSGIIRHGYWDYWNDSIQSDVDKRLGLQISRSTNDSNRRSALKLKKEDGSSVSDSKLLYANVESRKQIKKCDKKSRGDSSKRDRKQVQWKSEVDVIYFSTHLAANGDRTGEVIERVMEPLREEWEQQRKGFYAKMVPYQMENHLKDRFISLLKI